MHMCRGQTWRGRSHTADRYCSETSCHELCQELYLHPCSLTTTLRACEPLATDEPLARTVRGGSVPCMCMCSIHCECLLFWSVKKDSSRSNNAQPQRRQREIISSLLTLRPLVNAAASLSTPSSLLATLCTSCANTPMDDSIPGSTRCTSE